MNMNKNFNTIEFLNVLSSNEQYKIYHAEDCSYLKM